jgi:hypothetical protein
MVVFYTIIDLAALNAFIIWLHKNPIWLSNMAKERRRLFLKELGTELVLPLVQQRVANINGLSSSCLQAIKTILNLPIRVQPSSTSAPNVPPGKCHLHHRGLRHGLQGQKQRKQSDAAMHELSQASVPETFQAVTNNNLQ